MADHPFKSLTKAVGGSVVSAGKSSAEFSSYIDTGSYILNGLFSGKLRGGGWPDNKVLALAGESTTGKTFFMFGIAKCFQDTDPTAGFMLFDTEAATTSDMMRDRGMDADRVIIKEPLTVQDFRTDAMRFLDAYLAIPPAKRPPFMMGLDSLGALSTAKEVADIGEGNDVRDMTRQQLLRGAFRTLRLKLSAAHVPMIVTNHTYAGIGPYAGQEMCLVAGTMIKTTNGSLTPIEKLCVGDSLQTLVGPKKVTSTFEFDGRDVYEVEFDDGHVIQCTINERFLINGEWVSLEELIEPTVDINTLNQEVETCTTMFTDSHTYQQVDTITA